MLETLAGRLKWERTGDGIRVEIPARLTSKERLYTFSLGLVWSSLLLGDILRWFFEGSHSVWAQWLGRGGMDSIVVLVLAWSAWFALTSVRLLLDPVSLKLEYCVFGIRWLSHRNSTRLLHNLRFKGRSSRIPRFLGNLPELQIDEDYRTRTLAVGVTREEADALIATMNEVFPFPKYLPSESDACVENSHA